MRLSLTIVLVTLVATFAAAQTTPQREVRDGKLVSEADPPVVLEFGKAFRYAGGQVIDIFKVAGAEQHFFLDAADGAIRRFYWVQFEHYYPSNRHLYDYTGIKQQPLQLGPPWPFWPTSALSRTTSPAATGPARTPKPAKSSCTPKATNWMAHSSACGSSTCPKPPGARS